MEIRMKSRGALRLVLIVFLALAAPLRATNFVRVADGALVDQAALIVVARVESAAAGSGRTEYAVRVEKVLKGSASGELRVRVLGGKGKDGLALKVYGAPSFRPG